VNVDILKTIKAEGWDFRLRILSFVLSASLLR